MRRKVVITAALLHNPPVVLFDEPLEGLDANAAVGFKTLIQTLAREGKTIVYSSHILDVVERVCDRVVIIDKGRLLVRRGYVQRSGRAPTMIPSTPSNAQTLRRLFLMLFLRGRGARGLQRSNFPGSIQQRLVLSLSLYLLFGLLAFAFQSQPILALAVYLHVSTFVFLGLFIASSAGEILFNKDESDILLHRPISSRELLRAKVSVLVQVCVWFAGLDDTLAGAGGSFSWMLASLAVLGTALVLWAALGRLAGDYTRGLQSLGEAAPGRPYRCPGLAMRLNPLPVAS